MTPKIAFLTVIGAATAFAIGCGGSRTEPQQAAVPESKPVAQTSPAGKAEEHAHKPGAHGGIMVEIGRDNYHAEAVFEKGGVLKLFILGKDEAKVQEVESQTLTAHVRAEGGTDSAPFVLNAKPQPDDAEGKTSEFAGMLPADLVGKKLEVTVPIRIAGERFRFGFNSAVEAHEEPMPTKVESDDEKTLYLTAGGKYTEADIKANGSVTASEKFKGVKAAHDRKPKPGDKICPITMTKANPKFTWTVGGKTYEFCCPPCVDEFVKSAKEQPDEIKDPGSYVKK